MTIEQEASAHDSKEAEAQVKPSEGRDETGIDTFYPENKEESSSKEADESKSSQVEESEPSKVETSEDKQESESDEAKDESASDKDKEDESKEDEGKVPEKYELKIPEGLSISEDYAEQIQTHAKELGLSQEQAQKLVDRDASLIKEHHEHQKELMQVQAELWEEELRKDKDFGGEKYDETVSYARKAIKQYASPEIIEWLEESKFGSNDKLVKMFARIGRDFSADTFERGSSRPPQSRDDRDIFYGSSSS